MWILQYKGKDSRQWLNLQFIYNSLESAKNALNAKKRDNAFISEFNYRIVKCEVLDD